MHKFYLWLSDRSVSALNILDPILPAFEHEESESGMVQDLHSVYYDLNNTACMAMLILQVSVQVKFLLS